PRMTTTRLDRVVDDVNRQIDGLVHHVERAHRGCRGLRGFGGLGLRGDGPAADDDGCQQGHGPNQLDLTHLPLRVRRLAKQTVGRGGACTGFMQGRGKHASGAALRFMGYTPRTRGRRVDSKSRLNPANGAQVRPTTRWSRWTISARPPKPRIERISAEERPLIFSASRAS